MAVKASATITLSFVVDIKAITRYYKLQASTAATPSVPTANPPSGWTDTEPSYTSGSTNTLYFTDLTIFTNGTFSYSAVSKSSSYEAAKEAYNKATAAQNSANIAQSSADNAQSKADNAYDKAEDATKVATNYIGRDIEGGLMVGDMTGDVLGKNVCIDSDSVDIRTGRNVLASFGADKIDLGKASNNAVISMRNGNVEISNFNRGVQDYTQFVCYGNLDVSALSNLGAENYKRGGVLTTIDTKNTTIWNNMIEYTWQDLSVYTWGELQSDIFVEDRDTYFETSLYAEDIDGTSSNGYTSAKVSLRTSKDVNERVTSEVDISADKVNITGSALNVDKSINTLGGRVNVRYGNAGTQSIMQSFGWSNSGTYANFILQSDKAFSLSMCDNDTLKSIPFTIAQAGQTYFDNNVYAQSDLNAIGRYRFNNGWIGFYSTPNEALANSGRLGWMGYDNSTTNFTISNAAGGNNYVNKAWTVSSDNRLKEDIENIPDVFVDIWKDLQPKVFKWNELNYDSEHTFQFGLIAQDVISAFEKYDLNWRDYNIVTPFKMMDDDTEYFSITYDNYHMLTSLVLQKTTEKVDNLEKQINELKTMVEKYYSIE